MCAYKSTCLDIRYEVKDLVQTIDFYNILLGKRTADLFPQHAVYSIKSLLLTLTFIENPKTAQLAYGDYNLLLSSDDEVYDRFKKFSYRNFANSIKIDPQIFSPGNHSFRIKDPNGIAWELSAINKTNSVQKSNFPSMVTVWEILKPLS